MVGTENGGRPLDAAQAVRNIVVDTQSLNCDFCCFSAHKMVGPTGIGVLYGKEAALQRLDVRLFGGGMVDEVDTYSATVSALPFRLEAGTPNIIGAAGLLAAIEALERYDRAWINTYEKSLIDYVEQRLQKIDGVQILGSPHLRHGTLSFVVKNRHPYDLASVIDKMGVALRVGHQCAIPQLRFFGEKAALRISPAFYNTYDEIDKALDALTQAIAFFEKWS